MKTTWGRVVAVFAWFTLAAFAVAVLLVVAAALGWSALPLEHMTINIDGDSVTLAGLDGWHAAFAIFIAVVAVLVALVVAAAAVVFALVVAVLGIAVALIAVVASLAIVASPALLVVWLVWRLVRGSPRPSAVAA